MSSLDLALEHAWLWFPCWVSHGYLVFWHHYTKLSTTFLPSLILLRYVISLIKISIQSVQRWYTIRLFQYGQMTFATIIINRIKLIIKKKWIKKIVSAFMLSLFTSFTSEILEESIIKKKDWSWKPVFLFKGFLIFALHCVRNSQVSFIRKKDCVEQKFQNLAWIWVPFFVTFLVYLQIRERFKRKVSTVFPSATNGNSTKKNSHVNMSDFALWRQLNCSLTMNLNWKITHVNVNQNKRVFRE